MKNDAAELDIRQKHVGRFLKTKREKAQLTQQDVSRQLDYTSPQFVSNWERGVSLPPMEVLPRLASLYAIGPKEMIDTMHKYHLQVIDHQKKELLKLFNKGGAKRARG
jgi:transcriptional regulator with XRE-family HTH domain